MRLASDDEVRRPRPLRVGVTGNIGSGKSTVARLLAAHGAAVIDADALARAATEDPEVLARIAAALGADLVQGTHLDRPRTAARVFSDPEALARLNAIVHPWVRARSAERERALREAASPPAVIVHDVPLLYESGLDAAMDAVIVVDAPLEARLLRVAERTGVGVDDLRARDAAQMPLHEKVARADFVVENTGDLNALRASVRDLWPKLLELHQATAELP